MNNENERKDMMNECFNSAKRFDFKRFVEQWITLFHKVISK